jgi:hypothetical protein
MVAARPLTADRTQEAFGTLGVRVSEAEASLSQSGSPVVPNDEADTA